MPVPRNLLQALALALFIAASVAHAQTNDSPSSGTVSFPFGGVTYVHRWSQEGQHEFTPEGDDDLDRWTDMITIDLHESVRDDEQLAATANGILANYQGAGQIVRTDSKPRTETAPAEHFIAAVLGSPTFLEAAFARVMLIEGRGVVVVYSHRVYGQPAGEAMSAWLGERGQQVEETLMRWRDAPSVVRALREGD
jgi:hypothetical protein